MTDFVIEAPVIVVVSDLDTAGKNMMAHLLTKTSYEKLEIDPPEHWPSGKYMLYRSESCSILYIPEDQIYTDYFAGHFKTNLLIYASKHSSAAGQKSLLVHTTGNWNNASVYGGRDEEISLIPSKIITTAYEYIVKLQKERKLDQYWTGIECTHHGPTSLQVPLMYIETGGTEEEWNDISACNLIADVIWLIVEDVNNNNIDDESKPAMIGLGGNHYCSSFIRKLESKEYLIGHIIPKYAHKKLNIEMLQQARKKTLAENKVFLIDKKGARSADRKRFIKYIEQNNWHWEYS